MIKSTFFLICLVCLLSSCKDNKNLKSYANYEDASEKIELNKRQPMKISNITSGMKVVKLETSENVLLSNIKEIKIFGDFIYILDVVFKGIYVFDFEGNLIRKFQKEGKGPGEYLSINDFFIDATLRQLEVFDKFNMNINIYDLKNFKFKESISLPFDFAFKFHKKNEVYYFQTNNARNKIGENETNSEVLLYNPHKKQVEPLFNNILPKDENQAWEFHNIFTVNQKNDVFVSLAWHEQLYKIENHKIKPLISIETTDLEKYPKSILTGNFEKRMGFLNSKDVRNKIHFFKTLVHEGKNRIVGYGIGYPPKVCHYVLWDSGKSIYNTNNIQNDFLPGLNSSVEIFKQEKEYLISVIYAYDENQAVLDHFGITSGSNPVILLFKMKI